MTTIKNIESTFDNMPEAQRNANLTSLRYIKQLASTTQTNIARWDVLKMFAADDQSNLLVDKKAINKIFFTKLEKVIEKNTEETEVVDLTLPAFDAALQRIQNAYNNEITKGLEVRIGQEERAVEAANNRVVQGLVNLVSLYKDYASFNLTCDYSMNIKKGLQEVLASGYWVNPVVDGDYLYFNTPTNIILTHRNRAANIDVNLDVGQLAVKIDLHSFVVKVIPYKNNIKYGSGGYYHPHINSYGDVCWGNALATMQGFLKEFQIGKILELLYVILTSYNDGNPYVNLVYFSQSNKKYSRIPNEIKHPDRIKKPKAVAVTNVGPTNGTIVVGYNEYEEDGTEEEEEEETL